MWLWRTLGLIVSEGGGERERGCSVALHSARNCCNNQNQRVYQLNGPSIIVVHWKGEWKGRKLNASWLVTRSSTGGIKYATVGASIGLLLLLITIVSGRRHHFSAGCSYIPQCANANDTCWWFYGVPPGSTGFHCVPLSSIGYHWLPQGSSVPTGVAEPNWQFVIFDDDKDMFITHVSPLWNGASAHSYFILSLVVVLLMVGICGIRGPGTFYGVACERVHVSRIRNCCDARLMSLKTGVLHISIWQCQQSTIGNFWSIISVLNSQDIHIWFISIELSFFVVLFVSVRFLR